MQAVILTGATGGIGQEVLAQLLRDGFSVYATYHTTPPTEKPDNVVFLPCDVNNKAHVAEFFSKLNENRDIEIVALVNGAGVYGDDKEEELLRINVLGPYFMTTAFADYRKENNFSGRGAVINIGSIAAMHGVTRSHLYAASKAALHRLTTSQAYFYAEQNLLSVNAVVPGPVATNMLKARPDALKIATEKTPTGILTASSEIADMVSFLIQRRNNNIVGSLFTIDGGRTTG